MTRERWRGLGVLVRVATARPVVTILLSIVLAVASLAYTARRLGFVTAGRDLLPQDRTYVQRDVEICAEFSRLDELVVAIESADLGRSKAYARRLAQALRGDRETFRHVTYRIDPKRFRGRELLYPSPEKLRNIRDQLADHRAFLGAFAARPTLDRLLDGIRTEVVSAFVRSAFDLGLGGDEKKLDLTAARDVVRQISTRLDGPTRYRSPWRSLFSLDHADDDAGFFVSDDGRLVFVVVETTRAEGSFTSHHEAIGALRATMGRIGTEFPDVAAGLTGSPVLANDEMEAAFRDSKRAMLLAFGLTLGVLTVAFRRFGMPVLVLATLAVSVCWSLGVATLVVGHLSIFSIMFISIVVGLGTDYGVYLVFRNDEERRAGRPPREALEATARRAGPGMLAGALTAAGTFYVLMLTDFPGIRELGFIAGTSILLAWLSMMTLLPALVAAAGHADVEPRRETGSRGVGLVSRMARHPRLVLGLAIVAAALSLVALRAVPFDYNLLHLQARGTESVEWEQRIVRSASRSSSVALAMADSPEELRQRVAAFDALDSVSGVESVLSFIPAEQATKADILGEIAPLVDGVEIGPRESVDVPRLAVAVRTLRERLGLAVDEAPPGRDRDEVAAFRDEAAALEQRLGNASPGTGHALLSLQDEVRADFARTLGRLERNLHPAPIGIGDLPGELRRKFIGKTGRFLIQVAPSVDVWSRDGAERFVRELRSVDAGVAGPPVIDYEAIRSMERAYQRGTLYALVLVGILSAVIVRRARETALATVSLVFGALWTVGLMFVFGLPFNLGNVFGFPLVLGAGAEFGLNVALRYTEARQRGGPRLPRSTFYAVLANGLTTVVGFGSLMIAAHRGIFGLGLLLTLGMVATLGASLVLLPVLLRWTERGVAASVFFLEPPPPKRAAA